MERSILFVNEVIWQTSQSGKSGEMTDTVDGNGVGGDDGGGDGVGGGVGGDDGGGEGDGVGGGGGDDGVGEGDVGTCEEIR